MPGVPINPEDPECEEFYPDLITPARHHKLICTALQAVYDGKIKRLMIFAPPGSAKSTYTTVGFPPFYMGAKPKSNIISTSYGGDLARKFGRRCRSIVKSKTYQSIFETSLSLESSAADMWTLENQSEYMAGGVLSGITGNRAHGLLIDDPVKGREEADSEKVQNKTWDAYNDDLVTRLIPGGWQIIIQTRWNERDLSGMLLPDNYDGKTGWVQCSDGHKWYVICLPMECERTDDPLGRSPGDLLWSEWYEQEDMLAIKSSKTKQRTWSALYQQRPSGEEGDFFKREWLNWYDTPPKHLRIYGASDYAVTADGGDYTVHAVVGVDPDDNLYILDIWYSQTESNVWIDKFCQLIKKWKPLKWGEEQGQILKSLGPFIDKRMREERAYCQREQFTSVADKPTRARSFQARVAMGKTYWPSHSSFTEYVVSQMMSFPVGANDDVVDALGLIGRMLDQMIKGKYPKTKQPTRRGDYSKYRVNRQDSYKTV